MTCKTKGSASSLWSAVWGRASSFKKEQHKSQSERERGSRTGFVGEVIAYAETLKNLQTKLWNWLINLAEL